MNAHWEKVLSESRLISLPEVYLRLQQVLNTEEYALSELVEVIRLDPAISTRLLRIVNSSFFGLAETIESIDLAVNYLGAQQIHDLVLSTVVAESFGDMQNDVVDLHDFWQRSIYCAISARELALQMNVVDSERLFVAGLLHHIGHLMMAQAIPQQIREAHQLAQQQAIPQHRAEQQLLGFDASTVGAELLGRWNLPPYLVQTIGFQHTPEEAGELRLDAAILQAAVVLSRTYNQDIQLDLALQDMDAIVWNILGLDNGTFQQVDIQAQQNLRLVQSLLFPYLD